MAQFLVSVVCLAVLPTVQSKQVLSLGKDDCMIVQILNTCAVKPLKNGWTYFQEHYMHIC